MPASTRLHLILLVTIHLVTAAVPDTPRNRQKNVDCSGIIAFSAVSGGAGKAKNQPIDFQQVLLDKSIGFDAKTGIFTAQCPGIYQFNFSAGSNLKLSLRRRPSSATAAWNTVVETSSKGGAQTIFLPVEIGEELAIFYDSGTAGREKSQTFSGFRISAVK